MTGCNSNMFHFVITTTFGTKKNSDGNVFDDGEIHSTYDIEMRKCAERHGKHQSECLPIVWTSTYQNLLGLFPF